MPKPIQTIAAVSFLNARPLIEGLDEEAGTHLISDVPSRLLETLIEDRASVALCPVIDFQLSPVELSIVRAGAIGSDGPTLTVRVFSRVPMEEVTHIRTDGDSHTSVALVKVAFHEMFKREPEVQTLASTDINGAATPPTTVLLIGDKVVRNRPDPELYPFELDLGAAWKQITDLPFVFASWMARADRDLGHLPARLNRCRDRNRRRTAKIAAIHAPAAGWPQELAADYLGNILRYELGPRELEAMQLFWLKCLDLGLIDRLRPLKLSDDGDGVYSGNAQRTRR